MKKLKLLIVYLRNLCYKKVKTFTTEQTIYYIVSDIEEILKGFSYEDQIYVINAAYKTFINHKKEELKLNNLDNIRLERTLKTNYLYEENK